MVIRVLGLSVQLKIYCLIIKKLFINQNICCGHSNNHLIAVLMSTQNICEIDG